nr:MAG TPA: hypothetical protein [Caudoviricetes sp.]
MRVKLPPTLERLIDDIRLRIILDCDRERFSDFFNYKYNSSDDIEKFIKAYNIKYKTNIKLDSETELFWKLELD